MKVIAIRPEPGLSQTLQAGAEADLDMLGEALFAIEPVTWVAPDPGGYDGLLLGSGNALRHAGTALDRYAALPVYAVGDKTAAAARSRGFAVARIGSGGLQSLLDQLVGTNLRLLRLAGEEHVPLEPPEGIVIESRIVYRVATRPMSAPLAQQLAKGALVLLHSAEAARHFASECRRLGVNRAKVRIAALGPRIAEAAGTGWAQIECATEPREAALLAMAQDMCH